MRSLDELADLESYWRESPPVFLVVERGGLLEARKVIGEIPPGARADVGDNTVYLFSSSPPQPEAARTK